MSAPGYLGAEAVACADVCPGLGYLGAKGGLPSVASVLQTSLEYKVKYNSSFLRDCICPKLGLRVGGGPPNPSFPPPQEGAEQRFREWKTWIGDGEPPNPSFQTPQEGGLLLLELSQKGLHRCL